MPCRKGKAYFCRTPEIPEAERQRRSQRGRSRHRPCKKRTGAHPAPKERARSERFRCANRGPEPGKGNGASKYPSRLDNPRQRNARWWPAGNSRARWAKVSLPAATTPLRQVSPFHGLTLLVTKSIEASQTSALETCPPNRRKHVCVPGSDGLDRCQLLTTPKTSCICVNAWMGPAAAGFGVSMAPAAFARIDSAPLLQNICGGSRNCREGIRKGSKLWIDAKLQCEVGRFDYIVRELFITQSR